MSEDLKPCPWCGTQPKITPTNPALDGDGWARVLCVNKECKVRPEVKEFGNGHADSVNQAVTAWNRRAGQQGEARPAREERERMFDGLLLKFQTAVANVARAHQEYLGKAMADDVYDRFATARDETIPALRHELRAIATQAAPEAQAEPAGEPVACPCGQSKAWCKTNRCCDAPAPSGERDTLRALLREAREALAESYDVTGYPADGKTKQDEVIARVDAALADGGAK